jgi:hypothetical protein
MTTIRFSNVNVNLDGFDDVFKSWNGLVGKDMKRRAEFVKVNGKADAPIRTGALVRSIDTWYGKAAGELEARIGANPAPPAAKRGYGYIMHEGSRPHVIRPVRAKALRFRVNGQIVYAAKVNHPGTRPRPYLTRWLTQAVN